MLEKPLKIGLIGCSGMGKSTVASELSKDLNLTFLASKGITRPILERDGYLYSEKNFVEKFLSEKNREFEVVDQRINEEAFLAGGFITDRTTLECFAYTFLSLCSYSVDELMLLEKLCKENMSKYTHLFYFPLKGGWIDDNGIRTTNYFLQRQIDIIIRGLVEDWGIKVIQVPVETMKEQDVKRYILCSVEII